MFLNIIEKLKWVKRAYYRKKYRLRNTHPKFLATKGLGKVSRDIVAGAYSYIGENCLIYPKVSIGNFTMLANDVFIIGGDHNYRFAGMPIVFNGRDDFKETKIGHDVWIGARSIIMAGVKIGNGAIIAAGSVVTKDIEPYAIYGGVPAKMIKMRFSLEKIIIHENMLNKPLEEILRKDIKLMQGKDIMLKSTKLGGGKLISSIALPLETKIKAA